jgi:hypothetical protein
MHLPRFFHRHRHTVCIGTRGPFGLCKVRLPLAALDTHLYLVGKTGKGKSSYLLSLALQLITQGEGVGVIDPHGDLVTDLIATLASYPRPRPWLTLPHHRQRVGYLDPRSEYVVPFNPLAARQAEPYVIAQGVTEAFRRTWSAELAAAPRFANLALYSLLVLIENRLSLLELPRLLTDKAFREHLLTHVSNPELPAFFHTRFDRWGKEAPLMIESLLNKATALTLNPYLAPMLSAPECLSLQQVMDEGRVLLVNLRTPDEETRNLLGSLLMTAFEQAALAREAIPQHKRRRFFLIVDEFQKFTANEGSVTTLAEILSECRKYRLHLIFAHQSWGQLQSAARLAGALEQAQVQVAFGTGRQTAEALATSLYQPDPAQVKHVVADPDQQERSHPLFESLGTQLEMTVQRIMRLRRRRVLVKLPESEQVIELRTPTVPRPRLSRERLIQLQQQLAHQIGKPRQTSAHAQDHRREQTPAADDEQHRAWQATLWNKPAPAATASPRVVFVRR